MPLCGGDRRFSLAIGRGRVNDLDSLAAANLFEHIIGIRDTEGELAVGDMDGQRHRFESTTGTPTTIVRLFRVPARQWRRTPGEPDESFLFVDHAHPVGSPPL